MRDLLQNLPQLSLKKGQSIDLAAVDATLLSTIADDAETTVNVIHSGVGALGLLLAHSAVAIEDGTVGADCVESLGFLMSELSDLAACCMVLSTQYRRYTASITQRDPSNLHNFRAKQSRSD